MMDVSLNNTLLSAQNQDTQALSKSTDAAGKAAQLEAQATDDALWRMAANNAMAKLKGFNNLAKTANDLS